MVAKVFFLNTDCILQYASSNKSSNANAGFLIGLVGIVCSVISALIPKLLPKVVFWEHDPNYLLQSETLFSEILEKDDLDEIPRPLLNK